MADCVMGTGRLGDTGTVERRKSHARGNSCAVGVGGPRIHGRCQVRGHG